MAESLTGLQELLDQLDGILIELEATLKAKDLGDIQASADTMLSSVRAINDVLPDNLKRTKGPFRRLQEHGAFVKHYLGKGNLAYVRSNVHAMRPDMIRLRAELAPIISRHDNDLGVNVEELTATPSKLHLRDAVANYTTGTFGSAIASAVNALERYLRAMRKSRMGIDEDKGRLLDVMIDLERGGHLSKAEAPLAHILRLYRNYSDHPSEFHPSAAQARMVVQFVFETLKSV